MARNMTCQRITPTPIWTQFSIHFVSKPILYALTFMHLCVYINSWLSWAKMNWAKMNWANNYVSPWLHYLRICLVSEWQTVFHYWSKNFLYSTQSPRRFSNLASGNRPKITLTIPGPKWVPALLLLIFGGGPFPGPDCFPHPLALVSTQLCNQEGP